MPGERPCSRLGVAVAPGEEGEVDLSIDELRDEAGGVILGKPVVRARGKKEVLVRIVPTEVRRRVRSRGPGYVFPDIVPRSLLTSANYDRCATGS